MHKHEIEFLFFGMWIGAFIVMILCIFVAWKIDWIRQLFCHHVDKDYGCTWKGFKLYVERNKLFGVRYEFECGKCGKKKFLKK